MPIIVSTEHRNFIRLKILANINFLFIFGFYGHHLCNRDFLNKLFDCKKLFILQDHRIGITQTKSRIQSADVAQNPVMSNRKQAEKFKLNFPLSDKPPRTLLVKFHSVYELFSYRAVLYFFIFTLLCWSSFDGKHQAWVKEGKRGQICFCFPLFQATKLYFADFRKAIPVNEVQLFSVCRCGKHKYFQA